MGNIPKLSIGNYEIHKINGIPYNNISYKILTGSLEHKEKGKLKEGEYSKRYDLSRYKFFLDAPFEISNKCCSVMKKEPAHRYGRESGRKAITGQTAEESMLRTTMWVKYGCNGFEMKNPISNPMSFWTEQDILRYIRDNNLEICSVYGEITEYYPEEMEGQMSFDDLGLTESRAKLKTTGCDRTGCMFCGFGCHLNNDQRFIRMKETHPKQYEWLMKPTSEGGMGYKEIIDWINEHGNLNIKY